MDSSFFNLPKLPLVNGVATGVTTQYTQAQGKNLLNISTFITAITTASSLLSSRVIDNDRDCLKVRATTLSGASVLDLGISYKPNTQYAFSLWMKATSTTAWSAGFYIEYTDGSYSLINRHYSTGGTWGAISLVTTVGKTVSNIKIYSANGQSDLYATYIDLNTVQIEQSTVVSTYEPYIPPMPSPDCPSPLVDTITAGIYSCEHEGNLYRVDLPEMRSVPGIADYYNIETKIFTQNIFKYIVTGTDSWSQETLTSTFLECYHLFTGKAYSTQNGTTNIRCSHFKQGADKNYVNTFIGRTNNAAISITVPLAIAANVTTFKAWLAAQYAAGTPVTIYYQLATPVVTTIEPELVWEAPVTDRVEADCVYGNPKGCLSAAFLNRMEMNTKFISDYIDYLHIKRDEINTAVDKWSRDLYLRIDELNRQEQNLINLRNVGIINLDTPLISKSSAESTPVYTTINNMEKLLLDIKILLDSVPQRYKALGTFTLGNNNALQLLRR